MPSILDDAGHPVGVELAWSNDAEEHHCGGQLPCVAYGVERREFAAGGADEHARAVAHSSREEVGAAALAAGVSRVHHLALSLVDSASLISRPTPPGAGVELGWKTAGRLPRAGPRARTGGSPSSAAPHRIGRPSSPRHNACSPSTASSSRSPLISVYLRSSDAIVCDPRRRRIVRRTQRA